MPNNIEKQKEAMKFTSDYVNQLVRQELLVERIVARKWDEIVPKIEQLIEQKVKEQIADILDSKNQ